MFASIARALNRSCVHIRVRAIVACAVAFIMVPDARGEPPSHSDSTDTAAILRTLNDLHSAAAASDEERYFADFAPDAVFLGTDPSERWDMVRFREYAHPHFASGKGWAFAPSDRHIVVSGDTATFDEQLQSAKYGLCRGTGSLRRVGSDWKVTQYNLSFPVPNELAPKVVALLRGTPPPAGNQPPVLSGGTTWVIDVAQPPEMHFECKDADGDPLFIEAEGLPSAATFERKIDATDLHGTSHVTGTARWPATVNVLGPRRFTVKCSDGHAEVREEITVKTNEVWDSWMVPGVEYTGYFPAGAAAIGNYNGATLEFEVFAFSHRNDNAGPAIGRFTLDLSLLSSTREKQSVIAIYGAGVDLSFERNPARRWLVPFFGLHLGGLHSDALGSFFEVTPSLGLHVWAGRNVFIDASVGYLLTTEHLDELRGLRASAGIDFALW